MDPINYSFDVKNPIENAVSGLQTGLNIRNALNQQQQLELQRRQQLQMQADLLALSSNKNAGAQDYASMMAKYPQLAEHFKKSWDVLSADQQQTTLNDATQAYAALQGNKPEVAIQLLTEKAKAYENSGQKDHANKLNALVKTIELNPDAAKTSVALMLSTAVGPDKFADTFGKLGDQQRAADKAPVELRKAEADAKTAEVKAKYADSDALLELEQKGWNIKKIKEDINIAKESNRIAAMNAATNREGNALKKQELQIKIDEAKQKLNEQVRTKTAEVESARSNIDNMLNTADRILKNPKLNDVLGSFEGRMPAVFSDEAADAAALIETLGSQVFLSQIPAMKGTGSLSEKEGDKLQSSLQNLSRVQSETQFKENLKEAQRLMIKARKNLTLKYGVPETVPDTPAATPSGNEIDALLKKYGAK